MKNYTQDFHPFKDHIWLNAASEGPLPVCAAKALEEAVHWKSLPYLLDIPKFASVPVGLKSSIGKLIGVPGRDVILANSASYGLHLLANGLPWQKRDEILLMQNDFPTDILPWLALEKQGVKISQIPPKKHLLTPDELLANITPQTKLVCLSHVHTFSGFILDIPKIAKICQDKGILFVLNISQSVGSLPVDISQFPVDAVVSAGYKWLCGPYGTGFCWIKPEVREQLNLNHAYWVSLMSEQDLKSTGPLSLKEDTSARKFDMFGTANFFNFVPFKTAIDYWLDIGLENVATHNQNLIDYFIDQLPESTYDCISPKEKVERSGLVVISHKTKGNNARIWSNVTAKGIHTALWKNNIRISPHVYNTQAEMDMLLETLKKESKCT